MQPLMCLEYERISFAIFVHFISSPILTGSMDAFASLDVEPIEGRRQRFCERMRELGASAYVLNPSAVPTAANGRE